MTAADWIAKRRELLDAATEGPWDYYRPHVMSDEMCVTGGATSTDVLARGLAEPDAALVMDARTSLPRALDALEAVLALHSQHNSYVNYCRADGEECPCPTVAAIESALRGES